MSLSAFIQSAASGIAAGIVETLGELVAKRSLHDAHATSGNGACNSVSHVKSAGRSRLTITQTVNGANAAETRRGEQEVMK